MPHGLRNRRIAVANRLPLTLHTAQRKHQFPGSRFFGRIGKLLVGIFLILRVATATYGSELPQPHNDQGLSTLNIRLISKIIRPPQELVTSTLTIPNVNIARPMVGPPSKSAILEDDQRHRMVVLTAEDNGGLTAYMLDHIDLAPHVQELRQRAIERGCGHDRMSITGGIGCVAICVKDIIEAEILP